MTKEQTKARRVAHNARVSWAGFCLDTIEDRCDHCETLAFRWRNDFRYQGCTGQTFWGSEHLCLNCLINLRRFYCAK